MSVLAYGHTGTACTKPGTRLACWAVSVSCVSFGAIAEAQSREPHALEEVIVTAQKQSENLQEVPVPVTVVDAVSLTSSNQLKLQDYYNKVPGLSLALIGNGSAPAISIRGITTGGVTNPTVGIVVDDVPYGTTVSPGTAPTAPDVDPGDLARVEVLRGPQGTLYGASSIGGLLKFVTIDPSTEVTSGRLQAGLTSVKDGDDLGHTLRGAVNVPIGETFAVRASGFTTRDPGYVDNIQTGQRDVNRRDNEGGRVGVLWQPSNGFSMKLSALVQESQRLGTSDVDAQLGSGLDQRALRGTGPYDRHTEAYSATLSANLGKVNLTSVTGYSVDNLDTKVDQSHVPLFVGTANSLFGVTGAAIPLRSDIDKFSQELRLTIPVGDRVTWLIGGFYTDEDVFTATDVQATDPATGNKVGSLLLTAIPTTYEETAVFTNVTVDITDRFDVQFGGRLSENEQSFGNYRAGPMSVTFFGTDPFISPTVKAEDSPFTYLVTPRFRLSPEFMAYARFASGFRPGGPNAACGIVGIPCRYEADTTDNYELGFKGSVLEGALTYDASLYYIDWKDIQIQRSQAGIAYNDNASRATSQGVELSIASTPLAGMTLSGWVAWNDAELDEPLPTNSGLAGQPGDRLPYSSRVSGSLSLDQEFPLGSIATGFLGASVSYVGDRKGVFRGATAVRETFPSYTQLDVRLAFKYEDWTLETFVNNVTDERGILRSGLDALRPTYLTYIQPRTAGLSLTKTF